MSAGEGLSVVVRCHHLLFAIGAHRVSRLLLGDEVPVEDDERRGAAVTVAGHRFAAWDLGELLALPATKDAWVVVAGEGGLPPLALRTGPCVAVVELRGPTRLPTALFRARGRAFGAAYPTTSRAGALAAGGGLAIALDPDRLLSADERRRAAAVAAQSGETRA